MGIDKNVSLALPYYISNEVNNLLFGGRIYVP
jgi:hypothetical protein